MIEWHKAKDGLPLYSMPVLVAGAETDGTYPKEYIHLMELFCKHWPDGDENMWRCIYDAEIDWINDDDQWAYINLPEPEKDGDSD